MDVVLLNRRIDRKIDTRRDLIGVHEVERAGLQNVSVCPENKIAACDVHPSEYCRLRSSSAHAQIRGALDAQLAVCQIQIIRRHHTDVEMQVVSETGRRSS